MWVIAETRDLPVRYHQDRRHRRPGPLCRARSAQGELRRLGARLWPRRFTEGEERTRQATQSHRRAGAGREGRRAVLPGDLLVLDAADSDRGPVRTQERARPPRKGQAVRLPQRHEEQRLRRLPSARPAVDSHDPEVPHGPGQDARGSLGAPHPVGPVRRADDQSGGRRYGRRAVQVLRRVDAAGRERRITVREADPAAGCRTQHRRHAA